MSPLTAMAQLDLGPTRPRVLVVDDEKFIRDILADFLGIRGASFAPPRTALRR